MPTLNWLNHQDAKRVAQKVPYRLLETVPELCVGDLNTENMLIQGDNLQALKALLPMYAGKVKCIYIDPPYNTRSAFEHYDDNLEHSVWLSMMCPRLELLRELLAEDGSIWVSIDDNEAHYLKVMMDEVFGRKNFVTTVIWRKNYSPKSTARHFSEDHDYIVVYAKDGERWSPNLMPRTAKQDKAYRNPDKDSRGPWKPGDLSARNFYSLGTYPIKTPSGREIPGPPNAMYWRVSEMKLQELDEDNRIWWGKDGSNVPAIKRFLSEVKQGIVPQTWWSYEEVGHTQEAKKEIVVLFSDDVFGTPKPERLIERVLHIATNPSDLVLDSFLGSGTTTAVAHKMNRRYIGIEMGDHAQTHCQPRLQKVVEGEQGGISQTVNWTGGGGFRFYRLGCELFDEYGTINPAIGFASLAAHIWYMETRTPLLTPADSPLLGIYNGTAYYLLYNGILRDRRPQSGNVLTRAVLDFLPLHDGKKIIYGETSRLGQARLDAEQITFKQIPYDVRVA
ncbi:MAG: site-specific DNA-methyltransferase [Methylococcaceae bacterium]